MKIRELLTGPEKWCRHTGARMVDNKSCSPSHVEAVKWCLAGAASHCYGFLDYDDAMKAMATKLGGCPVLWNDRPERTFEDVKKLVDELDI